MVHLITPLAAHSLALTLSLSLSACIPLSVFAFSICPCLPPSHTRTPTHTPSHTHTHTPSHTHTHTPSHTHARHPCLHPTHTHARTPTHSHPSTPNRLLLTRSRSRPIAKAIKALQQKWYHQQTLQQSWQTSDLTSRTREQFSSVGTPINLTPHQSI